MVVVDPKGNLLATFERNRGDGPAQIFLFLRHALLITLQFGITTIRSSKSTSVGQQYQSYRIGQSLRKRSVQNQTPASNGSSHA